MRTLKNSILTLSMMVLAVLVTNAAVLGEENQRRGNTSKNTTATARVNYTRAILKNGTAMPLVTLPVVNIVGARSEAKIARLVRQGHNLMPVVNLPEVVITAEKTNNSVCIQSIVYNGTVIPMVNLPEVEISAERINGHMVALVKSHDALIPMVELPEVEITASLPENNMLPTVLYNGNRIALVNLPVVEISAQRMETILADNMDTGSEHAKNVSDNYRAFMSQTDGKLSKVGFMLLKNSVKKLFIVIVG